MNKFSQSEVYKLHQIIFCMDSVAAKVLEKKTKISYAQFLIFVTLEENPNFTQLQIGEWVNLTKSAISQQVDKLVQANFLTRTENPEDRREKILKITPAGKRQLTKAREIILEYGEIMLSVLNKTQRQNFLQYLNLIADHGLPIIYKNLDQLK